MLGCGHFRAFRPGFSLWHTCHVRHGHFTLKQLRLPVLNEMHTNSCTGPRLTVQNNEILWIVFFFKLHFLMTSAIRTSACRKIFWDQFKAWLPSTELYIETGLITTELYILLD